MGKKCNGLFEQLSDKFHVCTYDRRQNGASQLVEGKQNFLNAAQQARDVVAIMRHLGYGEMCVFGNSGGEWWEISRFSVQVIADFVGGDRCCDRIHSRGELPAIPNAHHLPRGAYDRPLARRSRCHGLVLEYGEAYREDGPEAAWSVFKGVMTGYEGLSAEDKPSLDDLINFWENEFIVFSTWWYVR